MLKIIFFATPLVLTLNSYYLQDCLNFSDIMPNEVYIQSVWFETFRKTKKLIPIFF